ncbi:TPA: hypothetical protein ACH3X2_013099 [Trebouxia sp. C0005]
MARQLPAILSYANLRFRRVSVCSLSANRVSIRGLRLNKKNVLVSDFDIAPQLKVVHEGGWRNQLSRPVMTALGIPVIETWNRSVPIWQYHKNAHEDPNHLHCTH